MDSNEQIAALEARIAELEPFEAAVAALVADSGDGALLADVHRDRFALARRFRNVVRAKLDAQSATGPGTPSFRLAALLRELEARFPGAANLLSSEPPEPKLLAALDARLTTQERD